MRSHWRHLAAINAVSFVAQIVQIGTVPPALALQLESAGVSSTGIGLVAAAPWLAILIVGRYVPRLLRRWGFVRSTLAGLGLSSLPLLGMTATGDPRLLFALNFVFGVGLIVRWIACDTWIVVAAPPELRGRAIGTHETLMGCGIAMGPIVLATTHAPLWACLLLLAIGACLLPMLGPADVPPSAAEAPSRPAKPVALATVVAAGALAGLAETSAISFLPLIANQQGWALGAAAALFGFGLGGTLLQVPLGWLADAVGYRAAQSIVASFLLVGAVVVPLCAAQPVLLAVLLFCWGGAVGGMNTLAVIEAGQTSPADQTSSAMTAIALAYTLGSIVGPVLTGAAQALAPGFGLGLMAAAGVAAFFLVRLRFVR